MPGIKDLSIVNSNTAESKPVAHGMERVLCSPDLCGSTNLSVYRRTIVQGKSLDIQAGDKYHLIYVMNSPAKASVHFRNEAHNAEEGVGVLLVPTESAQFEATTGNLEILHMVTPKPPADVEAGLPGG